MAGYISEFLHDYAPQFLTSSEHTLKSYRDALTLYIVFLEERDITHDSLGRHCFERDFIEEWIIWLKDVRHSSPETCNIRLGSLRAFLEFDAHKRCPEVPLDTHAHQFRHAKATHWLEDGMNIIQISFLLGHASLDTTMRYLDITTDDKRQALATLEGEKEKNVTKKWKDSSGSLADFCGLKR